MRDRRIQAIALFAILLVAGVVVLEAFARRTLGFAVVAPGLRAPALVPSDARRVFNALYHLERPDIFRDAPFVIETFDPVAVFGARTSRPPYLFKPEFRLVIDRETAMPQRTGEGHRWTSNSFGFRGPSIAARKPAGTVRIVCLGASTTEGQQDDDETYPAQLQRWLERRHPQLRFEVINAGHSGLSSHDLSLIFRSRVLPLEPDVLIYYELGNGIGFDQFVIEDAPAPHEWLYARSALFRILVEALAIPFPPRSYRFDPSRPADSLASYLDGVRSIVKTAHEVGVEVVLATPVHFYHEGLWTRDRVPIELYWQYQRLYPFLPEDLARWYASTGEGFRAVARELGTALVDADALFERKEGHFARYGARLDPSHLSPSGNEQLAAILGEHLTREILPRVSPRSR